MVSFSCEVCNDTVIKKRLPQHQRSCRGAYFTCIDCNTTFQGNDHNYHTSCITEAEKYEGALYKDKKTKKQQHPQFQYKKPVKNEKPKEEPKKEDKKEEEEEEKIDLSKYTKHTTSLYKVFKAAKKNHKSIADKTEFLKSIKVSLNKDGSYNLSL